MRPRRRCTPLWLAAMLLALGSAAASAGPLELSGSFAQGGIVHGSAEPGARVTLDEREVPIAPDGRFVFGFGRDAPPEARLVLHRPDGTTEERRLAVVKRDYVVQRIDGLPQETVTPDPKLLERIKGEAAKIAALRAVPGTDLDFAGPLIWPAKGPISGVYGSQRILNGEPRAPHMGVDVAAPIGTPVVAAAGGVVRLAEELFLTGNTILIDHGYGLTTSYAHLSRLDVAPGQRVGQGEPIGAIGATGRVTGPHLHWGLEWLGIRLDPQLAVGPMPAE
ncbi:MAG: M23 family metallopeptidase [Alphaproteobacteria bacterium]|nr:M23 family metallopeptidase [Alphaproteobacteria bacterium]